MPADDPRLSKLDKDLKAARAEYNDDYNPEPEPDTHSEGANIGYEFLAYIISGGLLGYGLDYLLGTIPLFFMGGMVMGMVGGVFRANARTKAMTKEDAQQAVKKNVEKTPEKD